MVLVKVVLVFSCFTSSGLFTIYCRWFNTVDGYWNRWSYELVHTNVTATLSYLELKKRFGVFVSDIVTRILRKLKVVLIEWASSNLFFILDTCDVQQKLVKEKIDFDLFRHVIHVIWSAVHENITGYLLYVSFWGLTAWIESFETLISHCIW